MTRKDYVKIAEVIRNEVDNLNKWNKEATAKDVILGIADGLSSVFREDNINYDRNRFMDACNL